MEDHVVQEVAADPAIVRGDPGAEHAELGGFDEQLAREHAPALPGGDVRLDLLREEAAHRAAERLVLRGEDGAAEPQGRALRGKAHRDLRGVAAPSPGSRR